MLLPSGHHKKVLSLDHQKYFLKKAILNPWVKILNAHIGANHSKCTLFIIMNVL